MTQRDDSGYRSNFALRRSIVLSALAHDTHRRSYLHTHELKRQFYFLCAPQLAAVSNCYDYYLIPLFIYI